MLVTYGHGRETQERTVELLTGAGVDAVCDVRTAPGSSRNPQFAKAALGEWLPAAGIRYWHEKDLGGWRRLPEDAVSPDTGWRNDSFAAYAWHMRTAAFLAAIGRVLAAEEAGEVIAVMCGEGCWWNCHRKLIADFAALVAGREVFHLGHDGKLTRHAPKDFARLEGGLLVYDGGQPALPGILDARIALY